MATDNPYESEVILAITRAKEALAEKDYERAAAHMRMVEVLAPLVNGYRSRGAAEGGVPVVPSVDVVPVPMADDRPRPPRTARRQRAF